ncbi:hypothetical protein [Enterobacter roggenkampii]|uniref:hypothetical protein n=1 Tax=Enterobacter roggenkampii TaxID=1812935 RepID=UPI0013B40F89|nr:hypothetical protein [Enterobacter roggenkampii]
MTIAVVKLNVAELILKMWTAKKCYKNYHIISDDFYFMVGMVNILSLMRVVIDRKVKIIDARAICFSSLGDADVVIIICSEREKKYVDFFSKMSRQDVVVVCSQLEVTIKKLTNILSLFSDPELMRGNNVTISEVLNKNEIDFLRFTMKGFTVLQYSMFRNVAPKTVYGYRSSVASKFSIDIKYFDHLLSNLSTFKTGI